MIHIDVKQGSPEWHEARYRKIGGSGCKGLFTKGDTLLIDMVSRFLEPFDFEESFTTTDMQRGVELEPFAIKELSKYTGIKFETFGWLQCEYNSLIGLSPDGVSKDFRFSAEVKCPSRKKHTETIINGQIPLEHLHQCLHYFTVIPQLEKHYFASFRPENASKALFVKELTRDSEINLGTKSKPVIKNVNEWVSISKEKANILKADIENIIKEIEF